MSSLVLVLCCCGLKFSLGFEFLMFPPFTGPRPVSSDPWAALGGRRVGCLCSFKALAEGGQSGVENDTTFVGPRTYQNDIVDIVLTK
jgi:hypothetical protein